MIRAERASDVQEAARRWQDQGGSLTLVTLTLRHHKGDELATTLDACLEGWRKLVRGAPWQRQKERLGVVGYVRAVEVTYGENGWHPHIHALLFTREALDQEQAETVRDWIGFRWARIVTGLGASTPSRAHGVDVRVAGKDGSVVAEYVTKLQDTGHGAVKIGQEVARGDLKDARMGGRTPFQLLDSQESGDGRRWVEYVEVSRGRRCITWSRDLRKLLEMDDERTDEEVMEDTDSAPVVLLISAETYDQRRRGPWGPEWLCSILEAVEVGDIPRALAISGGMSPPERVDTRTGEVTTAA